MFEKVNKEVIKRLESKFLCQIGKFKIDPSFVSVLAYSSLASQICTIHAIDGCNLLLSEFS